jgi:hypothetical protein
MVLQIISPVRWRETIERMTEMGVDTIEKTASVIGWLNGACTHTLECNHILAAGQGSI